MILVLRLPLGIVVDRIGFMKAVKFAMLLIGVFGFLRGFAHGYEELLILQSVLGVGFAFILPCLAKMVNALFGERAGFATGVYVSGFPTGDIAGITLASYLLNLNVNWRLIFQVFGAWGLTLASIWLLVVEERRNGVAGKTLKRSFKNLIKTREIWILTGICVCSMGCYDTALTWLPHILGLKPLPLSEASFVTSMLPLGFLISALTVGVVSDRLGVRRPFIITLGLIGGLSLSTLAFDLKGVLWILALIAGFSLSGILTMVLTVPAGVPKVKEVVGTSIGIISSIGNLGTFIFPMVVGFLMDKTSSLLAPITFLAAAPFSASMLGIALQETGRKEKIRMSISE